MPPIKNLIPLLIASALSILSVFPTLLGAIFSSSPSISFTEITTYSALVIIVIWLSLLLKNNIWAYLFLFSLLVAVFTQFQFGTLTFFLQIGPLHIDLFSFALLISHFHLNNDRIIIQPTKEEAFQDHREKIDFFKQRHYSKRTEELLKLLKQELVPEAKSAIEEIIEERNSKQ